MITYDVNLCMGAGEPEKGLAVKCHDTAISIRTFLFSRRAQEWSDKFDPFMIPDGATPVLKLFKPDKTFCLKDGENKGVCAVFALPPEAFTAEGRASAEVSIFGCDGERLTSETFYIDIPQECVCEGAVESGNYVDVFAAQIKAVLEAEISAKTSAALAEDYAKQAKEAAGIASDRPVGPQESGVSSFNGRSGDVIPQKGDYSADMITFSDGKTFQQKYDSGELKGEPGNPGAPGTPGKTPVKGEDYFTDADKQEIADAVAEEIEIVSSWNDLTDKPFHEHRLALMTEKTLAFVPRENWYITETSIADTLFSTKDETVAIIWDGVEYLCTVKPYPNSANSIYVGNATIENYNPDEVVDTGEPFFIRRYDSRGGGYVFKVSTLSTEAAHTISVYSIDVTPLDEKFIPDTIQRTITGTPGDFVVIGEDGKATTGEPPAGGGETWELINSLLPTEEAAAFRFTTDSDGNPLNLKRALLLGYYPKYTGASSLPSFCYAERFAASGQKEAAAYTSLAVPSNSQNRSFAWEIEHKDGLHIERLHNTVTSGKETVIGGNNNDYVFYFSNLIHPSGGADENITGIGVAQTRLYGGCKIYLYGVRA